MTALRLLMDFSDVLRALRVSRNLTQAELAAKCGQSQGQIARIECGYRPTDEQIDRIATALGVPRDALVGDASVELLARNPMMTVEAMACAVAS